MQQNILHLSTGNSIVQQSMVQLQTSVYKRVVNWLLLFELKLNVYLEITTSKAQIISALVTSCLLVHMLVVVCFKDNASLESPASLFNKVKALDEGSICLKNEIRVSFGNLS